MSKQAVREVTLNFKRYGEIISFRLYATDLQRHSCVVHVKSEKAAATEIDLVKAINLADQTGCFLETAIISNDETGCKR